MELYHFSEDPSIREFRPHVPPTNPSQPPSVWAIDAEHAPLYWFPRDCPRVAVWSRNADEQKQFSETFITDARRLHAVELRWLERIRTATLYRYTFDGDVFRPWEEATGQWVSSETVLPVEVEPTGDLMDLHVEAGIELRAVPSLWPLRDAVVSEDWEFSIVRFRNAHPPDPGPSGSATLG